MVRFELNGTDTLVPDDLVPVIKNLQHLVRNALDHGLERPSERRGKASEGLLQLLVTEQPTGWSFVIEDDGKGINTEMLVAKAVKRSIIDSATAAGMSEQERCHLIFWEGLSTQATATDISGRGVGMCAVREAVDKVGGTIDIVSVAGRGTKFSIFVPRSRRMPLQTKYS